MQNIIKQIPPHVIDVIHAVQNAGGRALLVGGCVRDALLDVEIKDWDLEIYGLLPGQLEETLDKIAPYECIGKSFGIYHMNGLDIALPRSDQHIGQGHRGFAVTVDPSLSFHEASRRRDLTINSMGYDLLNKELLDPHGGQNDLAQKHLRATDPLRFSEDPLRGLRVAQFAARFCMTPLPELIEICERLDLSTLSAERLWGEFEKLFLKGAQPSLGLKFLDDCQLINFFPHLKSLQGVPQNPHWHPEGDVWIHTLMVVDAATSWRIGERFADLALMMSALCHDFGKPSATTLTEGRVTSRGHELAGVPPTQAFLKKLKAPHNLIEAISGLVRWHLAPIQLPLQNAAPKAYRRLARNIGHHGATMAQLWRLSSADQSGRGLTPHDEEQKAALAHFKSQAENLKIWQNAPKDCITGKFLISRGHYPGPHFKKILEACRDIQDQHPTKTPLEIYEIYQREHVSEKSV